jgi:uncharacterized membrane-anchored protein
LHAAPLLAAGNPRCRPAPSPKLDWSAYLSFEDEGYVKDDEQIDAAALLQTLKDGSEQSNKE